MRTKAALAFLAAYAVLLALSAPPWPDDWDGLGFVASESRFDMDHFAPHPPGYPVYVLLLRAAHLVLKDGVVAASAVAVASGVATVCLAWSAAGRALTKSAELPVALAVAAPPLAWRADSAIGSEAPALALLALGLWALVQSWNRKGGRAEGLAAALLGVAVGLGMGVRLSWAPLFLPMLALAPRDARLRAAGACVIATAAWAAPLAAVVGPGHLAELFRAHFAGHAERWGGTVVTDPGVARLSYLARDVVVDGLGADRDPLGIVVGLAVAFVAAVGVGAWRRAGWAHARDAAILLGPYLLWIALGQNLKQQPRHALPLVVAASVGLSLGVRAAGRDTVGVMLAIVVGLRTASDAYVRRTTPPAAQQLVSYVRALPDAGRVAVFGTTSVRFFETTELAGRAVVAGTLGEALVAVGKMGELPSRALVTGEVDARGAPAQSLVPVATFCRPPRIDRRAACLAVFDWQAGFLRKE